MLNNEEVLFCSVGSFAITRDKESKAILFHDYKKGNEMLERGSRPTNDFYYAIGKNHLIGYITIINMYIDKFITLDMMYKQLDNIRYSKF